tara:strand:+ start:591 stop:1241 length:651 start_codon:yes stop_codon:yes gene_type:complete
MIDSDSHIVFDLDDTLYKEIDFVKSAYVFINNYVKKRMALDLSTEIDMCINKNINFFDFLNSKLISQKKLSIDKYLELYRFHFPNLLLPEDTKRFLNELLLRKIEFSILTDGRSISQRNKIHSLGIFDKVKNVIISEETGFEKPNPYNFKLIEYLNENKKFIYIGDNTSKDFIAPNNLNWDTICLLDNGRNIHKQNFDLEDKFIPKIKINNLTDLI